MRSESAFVLMKERLSSRGLQNGRSLLIKMQETTKNEASFFLKHRWRIRMSIENIDTADASSDTYGTLGQFSLDSWNGRSVTIENITNKDLTNRIILCGERCHGEASFDISLDNDENKSVDAEVKVESEDGKISGVPSLFDQVIFSRKSRLAH